MNHFTIDPCSLMAHSPSTVNPNGHMLLEHLREVAAKARAFAEKFGFGEIAYQLGITHDLAKADPRFQSYLQACAAGQPAVKCPHAAPSARAVQSRLQLFTLAVLGHHMGLKNPSDAKQYLVNADPNSIEAAQNLLTYLGCLPSLTFPEITQIEAEMLIRMLFSALVDADFLDTESHFAPHQHSHRNSNFTLRDLKNSLDHHMQQFENLPGKLNEVRGKVLQACRHQACAPQGVFRLTVPTGGGKTLASLTFALDHAITHQLDRVIVAIPYTSIIDQTAAVYENIFGSGAFLEHHSAIEPDIDTEGQEENEARRRLAAENWDVPLVVTTTVQLFESLFHNKTSRCRKLHNIARSVIVLDEVQTLPAQLLTPILEVLGQLTERYGCSLLLCTATQPDFSSLQKMLPDSAYQLLYSAQEIVPSPERHFQALKRVTYVVESEPLSVQQVAERIQAEPQILCVFNTRKDAVRTLQACEVREHLYHLSTLMCPHHRKRVLETIRHRLKQGLPVRLISTQVVEAGVDISFPIVMRVLGPLDRIIQTAGRCNREGEFSDQGRCVVFQLDEGSAPSGAYATGISLTAPLILKAGSELDRPDILAEYFKDLYKYTHTDKYKIMLQRERFNFETVAHKFRMIPQDTVALLVENYLPVENPNVVQMLLTQHSFMSPRAWFRRAGQFCVSVIEHELKTMKETGLIRSHDSGLLIYSGSYSELYGIGADETRDPYDLIV